MKKTLKELLTLNEPEKKKVKKGLVIALIISVTIIICYFAALGIYYGALNKKTGGKYVDRDALTQKVITAATTSVFAISFLTFLILLLS